MPNVSGIAPIIAQAPPLWVPVLAITFLCALLVLPFVGAYLLRKREDASNAWVQARIQAVRACLKSFWVRSPTISAWILLAKAIGIANVTLTWVIVYNLYDRIRPGRNGQDLFAFISLLFIISLLVYLIAQVIRVLWWMSPNPRVKFVWPSLRDFEFVRGRRACLILSCILLVVVVAMRIVPGPGPMSGIPAFVRLREVDGDRELHGSEAESTFQRELRSRGYRIVTESSRAKVIAEIAIVPGEGHYITAIAL